jgi:hypothetical protein
LIPRFRRMDSAGEKSHRQLIDCIRSKDTDALVEAIDTGGMLSTTRTTVNELYLYISSFFFFVISLNFFLLLCTFFVQPFHSQIILNSPTSFFCLFYLKSLFPYSCIYPFLSSISSFLISSSYIISASIFYCCVL